MIVYVYCIWYYFVFCRVDWCIIYGIKYKKGVVVYIGGDGFLLWFVFIEKIVIVFVKISIRFFCFEGNLNFKLRKLYVCESGESIEWSSYYSFKLSRVDNF